VPVFAVASGSQPYEAAAFKAAQDAGKPVLVEIHADWCTECRAQDRVMNRLDREPAYANLVRFRVDFDHQKDIVKAFKARMQSTLVLFKGSTEVARIVGETDEGKIRAMLGKAL
jgi:thioredoxin-like negative regulator of GroEL